MNFTLKRGGLLLFIVCITMGIYAQKQVKIQYLDFNTTDIYKITMKDESTYMGNFVTKKDSTIIISTKSTTIELLTKDIASVKTISESSFVNGKYWFPNPHPSRYFFSPSAFNLKKGEGYYQNIYGTINSVTLGLSDHFTLGVGTELISLFSGNPVLILTPKVGGYNIAPKWKAGGGAILATGGSEFFGIGYGIVTQGREDRNITFGLGWAFSSEGTLATRPVVTVSGMSRFRKNIAFVTENWLIPADGYEPFISFGLRFFGENLAVDVALINSPVINSEIIPIGIPYIDFVYKF